ncbi:hypothetical protein [Ktedonobacter racemifer]|uniref:Uncharacterized protein n=1 Tax=Ktedonobacter racemifer DSM 44963 TaxID=485913 RepID=D6TMP4_KTERA|nr:hypothetical protein [Ktedonobacter racemifer]EFH87044.1 hypothetical protein Krac_8365 [Ktedonobacter racemifer DSM 44963]
MKKKTRLNGKSPLSLLWSLPVVVVLMCVALTLSFVVLVNYAPIAQSHTSSQGPNNRVCKNNCRSAEHAANTWIKAKSASPADIAIAAQQTEVYQTLLHAKNDPIGKKLKNGVVSTPVLIYPYRDDLNLPPMWELPILNGAKKVSILMELDYDPIGLRIKAGNIGPVNEFNAKHTFPSVSQAAAIALVTQQGHIVVMTGKQAPILINFPIDFGRFRMDNKFTWTGGGTDPSDPIWRIATTDGHYYYVDHNGQKLYTGQQLPLDPTYLPAL